ncbi:MAG: magnesium/cobalt transporter CorA [Xanthomonadales bacterium]|nr:magnesium/cobalt transporter CorA [Xanthomonadales bacterium]
MKNRKRRRHLHTPGVSPGTITVPSDASAPRIDTMSWGPDTDPATVVRQNVTDIQRLPPLPPGHTLRWVNICGLGDAEVLQAVGKRFNIHPLALEDIANTTQRPKVEAYDSCLFIVARVPTGDGSMPPTRTGSDTGLHAGQLMTEQLSICVGSDFVLTFQEDSEDVFEPVRRRLMSSNSKLHANGADYFAYAIIDAAIDAFFPLLEYYGEALETLEADVISKPALEEITRIHDLKRNLLTARRAVWPQREMLNAILRDETPFIGASTKVYLRDCYDHTVQLIDAIETYREIASGLVDILLSSQSNRMNEIMKVLTIISTIFIPLSFVAGVYGMNFDTTSPWNMPELSWKYGYPVVVGGMISVGIGLLLWFRHRGWLGKRDH